eukprot:2330048-Prymnesium_polylepis.2
MPCGAAAIASERSRVTGSVSRKAMNVGRSMMSDVELILHPASWTRRSTLGVGPPRAPRHPTRHRQQALYCSLRLMERDHSSRVD